MKVEKFLVPEKFVRKMFRGGKTFKNKQKSCKSGK